jgi:hypothetical protein
LTHPGIGYSEREGHVLEAEEVVEIRVLRRQGKSIRPISRILGTSRNTMRRYLLTEGLPRYQRGSQPSSSTPTSRISQRSESGNAGVNPGNGATARD